MTDDKNRTIRMLVGFVIWGVIFVGVTAAAGAYARLVWLAFLRGWGLLG